MLPTTEVLIPDFLVDFALNLQGEFLWNMDFEKDVKESLKDLELVKSSVLENYVKTIRNSTDQGKEKVVTMDEMIEDFKIILTNKYLPIKLLSSDSYGNLKYICFIYVYVCVHGQYPPSNDEIDCDDNGYERPVKLIFFLFLRFFLFFENFPIIYFYFFVFYFYCF